MSIVWNTSLHSSTRLSSLAGAGGAIVANTVMTM